MFKIKLKITLKILLTEILTYIIYRSALKSKKTAYTSLVSATPSFISQKISKQSNSQTIAQPSVNQSNQEHLMVLKSH